MDPRPLLFTALDQTGALVAGAAASAGAPSPCEGWTVGELTSHLCAVSGRVAVLGAGGDGTAVPSMRPDLAPAEWAGEFAARAGEAKAAWADDASLDRVLTAPQGRLPGRVVAGAYVVELTTHAWDLAVATGREADLDPSLALAALEVAHRMLPPERDRAELPFGPVVEVAPDAGPYERLAGWMGRVSLPAGRGPAPIAG